ncbi:MAG: hypothetical protein ACOY90_04045 [Candidatus Zhuqueibacterota bacterium]
MKLKFLIFLLCFWAMYASGQSVDNGQGKVSQISVPVMSITDTKLMTMLMDEFFIPETLVTRMEIIDVGLNGFGARDLVKVYPSAEIYFIEFISNKAQQVMNDWKFRANFQIVTQNADASVLSNYGENKPAYNIFISLLRSMERNYSDYPIKIKLERDSSTVKFEMWEYNETKLKFDPRSTPLENDILTRQAKSIVDSTYYDCIFIYKTVVDTVYLPQRRLETVAK